MDKIEQEFFEAFGIEPKCLNEEYSGCKYANDDNRKCCKQYKDKTCNYSYFWIYPPITPEIVLELIEILLECSNKQTKDSAYNYFISITKNDINYGVAIQHKDYDKIAGGYHNYEKNLSLSILKSCIQLKDEIQDQVKELFNGK